jgi:hypothetical protein
LFRDSEEVALVAFECDLAEFRGELERRLWEVPGEVPEVDGEYLMEFLVRER